jgi:hypothetical protein
MDSTSITSEVRKFIANKIASKETVVIDWLTNDIVSSKDEIEGSDLPFYRVCAFKHVRDIVKSCVGKYDRKPSTDSQIVLPGFEHLQVAYTVSRDGENVLVPVDLISDEELAMRAAEYDGMAQGCLAHALEIREYIKARVTMVAA